MTNVFCILISILKYKIHDKSISNTKYKILFPNVFQIKYKIHAKYFKYVFQIHVFQILPNTAFKRRCEAMWGRWGRKLSIFCKEGEVSTSKY